MNRPSPAGLEIDHGLFATGPDVLIEAEASTIGRGAGLLNWAVNERSHLILLPSALAPCVEEIFSNGNGNHLQQVVLQLRGNK
jgi:hypothetical protein